MTLDKTQPEVMSQLSNLNARLDEIANDDDKHRKGVEIHTKLTLVKNWLDQNPDEEVRLALLATTRRTLDEIFGIDPDSIAKERWGGVANNAVQSAIDKIAVLEKRLDTALTGTDYVAQAKEAVHVHNDLRTIAAWWEENGKPEALRKPYHRVMKRLLVEIFALTDPQLADIDY
jgi:hypothetical protein